MNTSNETKAVGNTVAAVVGRHETRDVPGVWCDQSLARTAGHQAVPPAGEAVSRVRGGVAMSREDKVAEDAILTTRGITSEVVMDAHEDSEDDEHIGHVVLCDFDGATGEQIEDETRGLPGFNLLFESSPGSYHFWNLTVRSAEDTLQLLAEMHCDPRHVVIGYRNDRWVLRTAPKQGYDGETYKESPELLGMWYNQTDRPQSRGHYNFARAVFDVPDFGGEQPHLVGQSYSVDTYHTLKDWLKEQWREDDGEEGDGV